MPRSTRLSLALRIALAGVALLGALLIAASPLGRLLDNGFGDLLFALRGEQPPPQEVVLVAIDEPSFSLLELQWPWPRGLHGELIEQLQLAGARVIAFDVLFAEPSDPVEDQYLVEAVARHGKVLMPYDQQLYDRAGYRQQVVVRPFDALDQVAADGGLVKLPVDRDGVVRRVLPPDGNGGSFAAVAAAAYLGIAGAVATSGSEWINYYGPPQTIETISYYQVLLGPDGLPPEVLRDKLVFVGLSIGSATSAGQQRPDHFPTPFTRSGGGYTSGVEIQATIAANLIAGNLIVGVDRYWSLIAGAVAALLFALLFARIGSLWCGAALIVYLAASALLLYWLLVHHQLRFSTTDLSLPPLAIYLLHFVVHHLRNLREKRRIRKMFSTYLSDKIVRRLEEEPERVELGGEEVEATILFLDIAGFTALSERTTPRGLLDILNRVLGEVSEIIIAHDGLVDKYIGDAVMAVWGAPVPSDQHAANAARAALEIRDAIDRINDSGDLPSQIGFRIGLNSGIVIAGNVGGQQHRNYTVLGDTVNLASRLEGVNNVYRTRIMVSEATRLAMGDGFRCRELDRVTVKGKVKPVVIFELQELEQPTDQEITGEEQQRQMNQRFSSGINAYLEQHWSEAIAIFSALQHDFPQDGPSTVYLERCREMAQNPPGDGWDGVCRLKSK